MAGLEVSQVLFNLAGYHGDSMVKSGGQPRVAVVVSGSQQLG